MMEEDVDHWVSFDFGSSAPRHHLPSSRCSISIDGMTYWMTEESGASLSVTKIVSFISTLTGLLRTLFSARLWFGVSVFGFSLSNCRVSLLSQLNQNPAPSRRDRVHPPPVPPVTSGHSGITLAGLQQESCQGGSARPSLTPWYFQWVIFGPLTPSLLFGSKCPLFLVFGVEPLLSPLL